MKIFLKRFWSKVQFPNPGSLDTECWLWKGARDGHGYGRLTARSRNHGAHRVAFELSNGFLDDGEVVRHTCNAGHLGCVSPFHMLKGSQADNIRDMVSGGRGNWARGESSGSSRLQEVQVLEIRKRHAAGFSMSEISRQVGVSKQSIADIIHKRSWKHLS